MHVVLFLFSTVLFTLSQCHGAVMGGTKAAVRSHTYIVQVDAARVTPLTAAQRHQLIKLNNGITAMFGWTGWACWSFTLNAGQSTSVYGFGPISVIGTAFSSPTWGSDGLDTSPANSYVEFPIDFINAADSAGTVSAVFANFASNFGVAANNRGPNGWQWNLFTRNNTTQMASALTGGGDAITTQAGGNTNDLQFVSLIRNNLSIKNRWRGTNATMTSSGYTPSDLTSIRVAREGNGYYPVKIALLCLIGVAITDAQHDALELLIKTSVGSSWGLP